jgi:hypothetical protein
MIAGIGAGPVPYPASGDLSWTNPVILLSNTGTRQASEYRFITEPAMIEARSRG